MISSIFSKTKPVNYLLLLGFLFVFFWLMHLLHFKRDYSPEQYVFQLLLLGFLFFSLFLVNFMVQRNQITGTNSFAMLYYILLIVLFPEVLLDENAILCSFFLLVAGRRIISLKTLRNSKLKILDATIWIAVASLFYDWALLFLILVYIAIYFYEPKNFKNWLVPLSGLLTFVLIASGLLVLMGIPDYLLQHYRFSLSLDRDFMALWTFNTKLLFYTVLIVLTAMLAFLKMGKLGLGRIITIRLVAIYLGIGLVVTFLKTNAGVYPVLITFFPAATLITKYVEVIKRPKVKEAVLILSVILPFILLRTQGIMK